MSLFDEGIREFALVFTESEPYFGSKLLKKGFTHVYILERLEGCWLLYDPTRYGLNLYVPCCSDLDLVQCLWDNGEKITKALHVTVTKCKGKLIMPPQMLNCVTLAGYILGVRFGWRELTPYRLYKSLLTRPRDGVIVKEATPWAATKTKEEMQSAQHKQSEKEQQLSDAS